MTYARPPGWYDEPSGDPSLLRWWDGQSWTAVTRERLSSEAPAPPPPATRPAAGPADLLDSGHEYGRGPAAVGRRGLVAAGLAVLLVGVLAFAVLPGRGAGDGGGLADPGAVATAPPSEPAPTSAPAPAPTTPRPVTGRVTDRIGRLSYDVLPGDWREWDRETFRGLRSTTGYYRITQQSVPNGQTYWANVSSGQLDPMLAAPDLRTTATQLVDTLARGYYPGHRRDGLSQQPLTVDGAPAYLVRYRAIFFPQSAAGYTAKSEQVAVLLVDTGAELPAVLYVSLPDTVKELWPAVDRLLASVRVVR